MHHFHKAVTNGSPHTALVTGLLYQIDNTTKHISSLHKLKKEIHLLKPMLFPTAIPPSISQMSDFLQTQIRAIRKDWAQNLDKHVEKTTKWRKYGLHFSSTRALGKTSRNNIFAVQCLFLPFAGHRGEEGFFAQKPLPVQSLGEAHFTKTRFRLMSDGRDKLLVAGSLKSLPVCS